MILGILVESLLSCDGVTAEVSRCQRAVQPQQGVYLLGGQDQRPRRYRNIQVSTVAV
jgi:hypothetical protein